MEKMGRGLTKVDARVIATTVVRIHYEPKTTILAEGYAYEYLHTHTTLMRVLPQFILYMLNRDQQLAAYKRIAST